MLAAKWAKAPTLAAVMHELLVSEQQPFADSGQAR
jgi:hypothetical protein